MRNVDNVEAAAAAKSASLSNANNNFNYSPPLPPPRSHLLPPMMYSARGGGGAYLRPEIEIDFPPLGKREKSKRVAALVRQICSVDIDAYLISN